MVLSILHHMMYTQFSVKDQCYRMMLRSLSPFHLVGGFELCAVCVCVCVCVCEDSVTNHN